MTWPLPAHAALCFAGAVGECQGDGVSSTARIGTCARMRVPQPGTLSISSVPPTLAARSRIECKPR